MTNLTEVKSQIRFQIDQLSSNNAHHDFEHLCRHLVEQEYVAIIIPATGPVSSGGDQGCDFETFRTYIRDNPSISSTFAALVTEKKIAFGCSLQKRKASNRKLKRMYNKYLDAIFLSRKSIISLELIFQYQLITN